MLPRQGVQNRHRRICEQNILHCHKSNNQQSKPRSCWMLPSSREIHLHCVICHKIYEFKIQQKLNPVAVESLCITRYPSNPHDLFRCPVSCSKDLEHCAMTDSGEFISLSPPCLASIYLYLHQSLTDISQLRCSPPSGFLH